jgi:polysaccharide export outer membrane protein
MMMLHGILTPLRVNFIPNGNGVSPMVRKMLLLSVFALGFAYSAAPASAVSSGYKVNVNDILTVVVLQPDKMEAELTVSPDGSVTFPYIGSLSVQGLTLGEIQEKIQKGLADYMKYPLVAVSLKKSRSRNFFVYGEVKLPGTFPLENDTTVLQAITSAGGFTRAASKKDVKVLRQKPDGSGNTTLTVNVDAIMSGKEKNEVKIEPGDVVTVSQRFF